MWSPGSGKFATKLRYLGINEVRMIGRSEKPVLLHITVDPDDPETPQFHFEDAEFLAGQLVNDKIQTLHECYSPHAHYAVIGPFAATGTVLQFYTAEVPEVGEFLRQLTDETRHRHLTLVHGDFSPKNILIHQDRLVLLDYEVIHWGDPAFDIGFGMTYLLSKTHHVRGKRDAFADAARTYWNTWVAEAGRGRTVSGVVATPPVSLERLPMVCMAWHSSVKNLSTIH